MYGASAAAALPPSSSSAAAAVAEVAASAGAGDSADIKPSFPALAASSATGGHAEQRSVRIPTHRFTPLKENWTEIVKPIADHMKLQIRLNTKTRSVDVRVCCAYARQHYGLTALGRPLVEGLFLAVGFPLGSARFPPGWYADEHAPCWAGHGNVSLAPLVV